MISAAHISAVESCCIDKVSLEAGNLMNKADRPEWDNGLIELSQSAAVLGNIFSVLDPSTLASALSNRGNIGRFMASIGLMNVVNSEYLFDIANDMDMQEPVCAGKIDLDSFFGSAAHAEHEGSLC